MPDYKIHFIEFACTEYPSDFFYMGYHDDGRMTYIPHGVTLIEGEGRKILVDSGIDFDKGAKTPIADGGGLKNRHNPAGMLAPVGLKPEDIDAIILTHAHFDHIGGISDYPNAMVYIQRREVAGFLDILAKSPAFAQLKIAYDPFDLHCLIDIAADGRLVLVDGSKDDLFPGVHVRAERIGHSFACQIVLVDVGQGAETVRYAIAGDSANAVGNLIGVGDIRGFAPSRKFALGGPLDLMENSADLLSYVDGDTDRIVMTHDCEKFSRYPTKQTPDGLHIAKIA